MYQNTAKGLAALGRNGDSMLMHVNPTEIAALSKILGPTTTNPKTGLPEAYGWSSLLGSALTGMGSFGVGAALNPVINEALGGVTGDLMKEAVSKAVPALAGAGIGAAVGGATGGRAGAMGGALQGGLSGGLGAYASEDMLGTPAKTSVEDMQQQEWNKAGIQQADKLYKTSDAQPTMWKPSILDTAEESPTSVDIHKYTTGGADTQPSTDYGISQSAGATGTGEKPGFLDNLGKLGGKAFTSEGFKQYEDYLPYLFQAGMIGNAVTAGQEEQDAARQMQENVARYNALRRRQAQELAQSTYSYADGGPVVMQAPGVVPLKITIPEPLVQKVKDSGGIAGFMQGKMQNPEFATGGYVNVRPFDPQGFYPQSHIPSAQPYAAAAPTSVIDTLAEGASFAGGGLIDGEGDGMSDDIDADIEGQEPVRVADGEYVIPRHIVDMIGTDRLDDLLKQVRRAAYGTEEQVEENAGLAMAAKQLGLA